MQQEFILIKSLIFSLFSLIIVKDLRSQVDSLPDLSPAFPDSSKKILFDAELGLKSNDDSLTVSRNKSRTIKRLDLSNLPYIMDDLMIIAGFNQTTMMYSIDHRSIRYGGGFQLGSEVYIPVLEKAFFHVGANYALRRFENGVNTYSMHRLEVPLFLAYELPEFRQFDWRFLIGFQLNGNLTNQEAGPDGSLADARYRSRDFRFFDFGLIGGLSAEFKEFYFRLRAYSGTRSLISEDSGAIAFFQFDFGYFIFRKFRKVNF
jgi:hypothetical protein